MTLKGILKINGNPIYEEVVDRNVTAHKRDPVISDSKGRSKRADTLHFSIYPIEYGKTRKIRYRSICLLCVGPNGPKPNCFFLVGGTPKKSLHRISKALARKTEIVSGEANSSTQVHPNYCDIEREFEIKSKLAF